MSKSSKNPRIPLPVNGIQVNYCKNVDCLNYGNPASTEKQPKGPGAKSRGRDDYKVSGYDRNEPAINCLRCNESSVIKSNRAISEETERFKKYLKPPPGPSCPNLDCVNCIFPITEEPEQYILFGETKIGSQRYRCKLCGRTLSIPASTTHRQRQSHKNRMTFKLLMNKSPIRRTCEIMEFHPATLYGKIDHIHKQCMAFARQREKKLAKGFEIDRLNISVDRQDYMMNWWATEDKRNVIFHAIGSADNITGYVFGMHLNFDPNMDPVEVEKEVRRIDDDREPKPHRKFSRLWVHSDYKASVEKKQTKNLGRKTKSSGDVEWDVIDTYNDIQKRDDTEVFESQDETTRLPRTGMQIHSEYTIYGHFRFLKHLFKNVKELRFFLDQESGIRAACLTAFYHEIQQRTCDAFYVRINKDLTVPQKRTAIRKKRRAFKEFWEENFPYVCKQDAMRLYAEHAIKNARELGKWKDRWIDHPYPGMFEPEKMVCYLNDFGDYDIEQLADLYCSASLHAIDRFFLQVRRRLCMLERPFGTASNNRRIWHGYSPYNPRNAQKLLDIFRVYYNYHLVGKGKMTPAMRLGLAKKPISLEQILYFK